MGYTTLAAFEADYNPWYSDRAIEACNEAATRVEEALAAQRGDVGAACSTWQGNAATQFNDAYGDFDRLSRRLIVDLRAVAGRIQVAVQRAELQREELIEMERRAALTASATTGGGS